MPGGRPTPSPPPRSPRTSPPVTSRLPYRPPPHRPKRDKAEALARRVHGSRVVRSIRSFEGIAIPPRGGGGRFVSGLQKREEEGVGVGGGAHQLIGQDELTEVVVPTGTGRRHAAVAVARGIRIGVGVEHAFFAWWSRQVPAAAHLMGVRLPRHVWPAVRSA